MKEFFSNSSSSKNRHFWGGVVVFSNFNIECGLFRFAFWLWNLRRLVFLLLLDGGLIFLGRLWDLDWKYIFSRNYNTILLSQLLCNFTNFFFLLKKKIKVSYLCGFDKFITLSIATQWHFLLRLRPRGRRSRGWGGRGCWNATGERASTFRQM